MLIFNANETIRLKHLYFKGFLAFKTKCQGQANGMKHLRLQFHPISTTNMTAGSVKNIFTQFYCGVEAKLLL